MNTAKVNRDDKPAGIAPAGKVEKSDTSKSRQAHREAMLKEAQSRPGIPEFLEVFHHRS